MKTKNIKVLYSSRSSSRNNHYTTNPKIQMEGKWLETLGFHIGDLLQINYEKGAIHITPVPQEAELSMVCEQKSKYNTPKSGCSKFKH